MKLKGYKLFLSHWVLSGAFLVRFHTLQTPQNALSLAFPVSYPHNPIGSDSKTLQGFTG